MPKGERNTRKTTEEFIEEMKTVNPDVEIIGEYINACTKIECKGVECGHLWLSDPKHLLRKQGCPICGKQKCHISKRKTQAQYEEEVYKNNPNIEILSEYTTLKSRIKVRCKICGIEREVMASCLTREKYGCPICSHRAAGNIYRKSKDVFISEIADISPNIIITGDYINDGTKIECVCNKCNTVFYPRPNALLKGSGCPHCFASKGEKKIERWLKQNKIQFETQKTFEDCVDKGLLRFDFYINDLNAVIEYDGEHHFCPIDWGFHDDNRMMQNYEDVKRRDSIKTKYCKDNNINLLRIPYTEFDNIEKILSENLS